MLIGSKFGKIRWMITNATRYEQLAMINIGMYPKDTIMRPAISANKMPAVAPAIPPMPVTDATTFFGKRSEAKVYILADHPW